MCACRQKKKSFLIEDILQDVKKKQYKNMSYEPTKPLICGNGAFISEPKIKATESNVEDEIEICVTDKWEAQNDIEIMKVNLEHRRNTYPLYPTPVKANTQWAYRGKEPVDYSDRQTFNYYSDTVLNTQMLRSHLTANRFMSHPFTVRQAYGLDRVPPGCCNPWWGIGGRRKGGQVRFTAAQTGTLERRFGVSKYLSPDERRALASTLRLSDRQVKTWFQNRRAKWRRTAPDSADAGSPPTAEESDDDVHIAEHD